MSFGALPSELQLRIISACIFDQRPASSFFVPRRHDPRVQQATALALVSEGFYAIVASILYRNLRVTRPSSLLQLQDILSTRPQLGQLVSKLHIGPSSELWCKGCPLAGRQLQISPSPRVHKDDEILLPRWCRPGTVFGLVASSDRCQKIAVNKALRAAVIDIDVELWRRSYSRSGKRIGVRAWAARLLLVQAALESYLVEMRRIEDARRYEVRSWREADSTAPCFWTQDACQTSACGHYPSLKVLSVDSKPSHSSGATGRRHEIFAVTEPQLWDHMLRRGGSADHFEHLIRFTRSSASSLGMTGPNEWRRVKSDLGGPQDRIFATANQDKSKTSDEECYDSFPTWVDEDSDTELPSSSDVGHLRTHPLDGQRAEDLLAACNFILAALPSVRSIALTSYFHTSLPTLCAPRALRSLVIGPRASYWDDVFPTNGLTGFVSLERLRIAGKLARNDAVKIARSLPSVRDVEWELPHEETSASKVFSILTALQGYAPLPSLVAAVGNLGENPVNRARQIFDEDGAGERAKAPNSLSPSSSSSRRHVLVLLHPNLLPSTLKETIPAKVRTALECGSVLPGTQHPVKVDVSDAVSAAASNRFKTDVWMLYAKSQQWWEEG